MEGASNKETSWWGHLGVLSGKSKGPTGMITAKTLSGGEGT